MSVADKYGRYMDAVNLFDVAQNNGCTTMEILSQEGLKNFWAKVKSVEKIPTQGIPSTSMKIVFNIEGGVPQKYAPNIKVKYRLCVG